MPLWLKQCGENDGEARNSFEFTFTRDPIGSPFDFGTPVVGGDADATLDTSVGANVHRVRLERGMAPGWWNIEIEYFDVGPYAGSFKVLYYTYDSGVPGYVPAYDIVSHTTTYPSDTEGSVEANFLVIDESAANCAYVWFELYTEAVDGDSFYWPGHAPLLTVRGTWLACPNCPEPI